MKNWTADEWSLKSAYLMPWHGFAPTAVILNVKSWKYLFRVSYSIRTISFKNKADWLSGCWETEGPAYVKLLANTETKQSWCQTVNQWMKMAEPRCDEQVLINSDL